MLLLRSRMGGLGRGLWLDGVIGAFAIGSVGTAIVLPAVIDTLGGSPAAVATNLAYPLADLILVALVVWALAVTGWRPGRTWGLLAAGLLVFAVSDCLYLYHVATASYVEGSFTDLGWVAGGVLLACAAWQPETARASSRSEGWPLLVPPVAFGLAGLRVLVYDHFERVYPLSLVLAGAAILAVIARMAMTCREHGDDRRVARRGENRRVDGPRHRRHLFDDLEELFRQPEKRKVLVLFDLNGFRFYSDTFGHVAGDLLLARLGESLRSFVRGRGRTYRMGGDEFCIVVRDDCPETELVAAGAARALSERGEGFAISPASGYIKLPDEAAEADDALRLADQRMYARKQSSRVSVGGAVERRPPPALSERHPKLGAHALGVAKLSDALARKLGLSDGDAERARLTGLLHDVGKMAIPDVVLEKPGPLDSDEWKFVRDHTKIGERILHGAPDLVSVADLVRSSLERFDSTGYPDGLVRTDIALVSRIVFVCDAFDAMTSPRPFADALTIDAALAELARNAGTQFDPVVVSAFAEVVAERGAARVALAS